MSKSKNNAIFFRDSEREIKKKISLAFSGGQKTAEEHRKTGGNPEKDVACTYLKLLFLDEKESKKLFDDYKKGKLLTSEVKKLFADKVADLIKKFQDNLRKIDEKILDKCILRNK